MTKPIKVFPLPPMIDYHDMIEYLESKYSFKKKNLWSWLCEREISNGTAYHIPVKEGLQDEDTPKAVKEILQLVFEEFGEELDSHGYLRVWISW